MILPKTFDENEWFIFTVLFVTTLLIIRMPKRLPWSITVLVFLYSAVAARAIDRILGGPPYDLYDINDTPYFDLVDLFTYFLYPAFGYFFVYLYEKWQLRGLFTYLYIVGCTILAVGFERLTVAANIFTFKRWTSLYSFPTYLVIFSVTLLYYRFLLKQYPFCKKGS